MKMFNKAILMMVLGMAVLSSCNKEDEAVDENRLAVNNVYITNEGNFLSGDGSISVYDVEADTVLNNVYASANNVPLGDVVQSMFVHDTIGYICVNNSHKVEVVNLNTFKSIAQIEVANPRYFTVSGNYGYVSSQAFGNGQIKVIDLSSNTITDSITVGGSPEQIAAINGKVYVAKGAWGADSTVSVINARTNAIQSNIYIGFDGPSAIKVDSNNNVWVLATGKTLYDTNWVVSGHTPSALVMIDGSTDEVSKSIELFDDKHPSKMQVANGKVMYSDGVAIYSLALDANEKASTALITADNYGFIVNEESGVIFLTQANSNLPGTLLRYSSEGALINEFEIGIFPNGGTSGRR